MSLHISDLLAQKFKEQFPANGQDQGFVHEPLAVEQIDLSQSREIGKRLHADATIKLVTFDGDTYRIEERGDRGSFIVATSRNTRIFKCVCGALDSVDRCKFCGSSDITIYMTMEASRTEHLKTLATAIKKVAPESVSAILTAWSDYLEQLRHESTTEA